MEKYKVIRDFSSSHYSDSELSIRTFHVIEKMTGNEYFPTPNPALDVLSEANGNYVESLNKMVGGSKENTVVKNNRRRLLETLLKQETDYVQQVSEGDEAIILSSGFEVSKKHALVGPLAKATGLTVEAGDNKGSIVANCNVVARASFYEFEYTDAPVNVNSIWQKITSTKHKVLFEGLTSGKQYVFRVAGAGSNSARNWSDEISSFVL